MKKRIAYNKTSIESINSFCKSIGVIFLDNYYTSNNTKHKWFCLKHKESHEMMYDKLKKSKQLNCCYLEKKQKQTLLPAYEYAKKYSLSFKEEDYKGAEHKIFWTCEKHNIKIKTTYHFLKNSKYKTLPCCHPESARTSLSIKKKNHALLRKVLKQNDYILLETFKTLSVSHNFYCNKHKQVRNSRPTILLSGSILMCCMAEKNSGENHPNFNPETNNEERIKDRRANINLRWAKSVKCRDNYICDICKDNKKCVAHHLNSYMMHPEQRHNIDNGITLCKFCHIEFHKKYGCNVTKFDYQKFKESHHPCGRSLY